MSAWLTSNPKTWLEGRGEGAVYHGPTGSHYEEGIRHMDSIVPMTTTMKTAMKSNTDAVVNSYQTWAAGCQSITQSMVAIGQARLEHSVSGWKTLSAAKSPKEALEIHSGNTWKSLHQSMADTTRLTNESMQLFQKMMAPLKPARIEPVDKVSFLGG